MLKKISALLLALVMVLSLASVAWAADNTYIGTNNSNATGVAGGTTIPLTKSIIFFNENGSTVYEPNITFSYAVEPASISADGSSATVTDGVSGREPESLTRNVYPGPAGGVTGTTIPFSTAKTATAAANGTEVEESNNLGVVISKFERPGIYRYKITETSDPADVTAAGLTARDSGYDDTRYLDVYIHYKANSDELEMYGAVIFKTSESTVGTDSITTTTEKTTGFEPGLDGSTSFADDPNVDKYTTYDFTVKKVVAGSMGDKNHEFPFYVSVANSINGAKFTYTADGSETFTGMAVTDGVATLSAADFAIGSAAKTSNLKLKDGDSIKLVGVPSNQTTALSLDVTEYNDTYDEYIPTVEAEEGSPALETAGPMTAQTGSASITPFDIKTNDTAGQTITVTNTLDEISPTGVVMRVAPYMLILAAGVALLLVSRRRKAFVEE